MENPAPALVNLGIKSQPVRASGSSPKPPYPAEFRRQMVELVRTNRNRSQLNRSQLT